ncbi:hypothetical protein JMJ35_001027 [Cladonia borealis]|uniref:Peptidase C14 caspase domain-containing protein n=1 Tax=Cladonia borealis TaxID=184061 RepID=A0AA39R9X0_9LECA|nr:hypothetical protein JMJ35_001027 [Cladonia borealis]
MRPPVERTHDISQIGYHMKDLRAFGEDLTNAAAGAFPKGKSRYKEVHVLLLSWEDDRLGVTKEINELRSVLDQTYHYHTEEWKIPSRRSHNSLIRRLTDFLDDYESKENLLLVYYGGHGHLNDDRQLKWSCTEFDDSPTVQWVGIQNMLEQATSDVLILLDCCAAATASAELGSGVTEELRYCCKRKPLSAAMLHMKVLSRMKYWKPKTVETRSGELAFHERRRTPVHTTLTNDGKPRSIVLSPIEPSAFLLPENSVSLAHSPFSDSSSQDVQMEDSSNDSAMTSIPSSVSSSGNYFEQGCPRVLIAVALEEDQRLQLDPWAEWLRDIPAIAKYARVEGIYESYSTLMLLSLPVNIWDLIPNNPAVSFIGFIKSQDLLKTQPSESSTAQAAKSAPISTSPPAVIEALASNDGLMLEESREWLACVAGQKLAETRGLAHNRGAQFNPVTATIRANNSGAATNSAELQNLEAAAAFLKHQDIERMANARSVIEREQPSEYRLKADELEWLDVPYRTDLPRAMATWRGESVMGDWQYCLDDGWKRAQNLTMILNADLRPPNLAVLHCVDGYVERDPNNT